jgi:hypothetical protein
MTAGSEPISDDEILYRRIPAGCGWYDPTQSDRPSPYAFRANRQDSDGISLSREKYSSPEDVCGRAREGKEYFVAELRAGDLRNKGLTLRPAPLANDPGHCVLTEICWGNASTDEAQGCRVLLANELTRRVVGPYSGKAPVNR